MVRFAGFGPGAFRSTVYLRRTPAVVRYLSCEPLLESIEDIDLTGIDWVIAGGESGGKARPFDLVWARQLKTQCALYGAAYFFKQLGANPLLGSEQFQVVHPRPDGKRD